MVGSTAQWLAYLLPGPSARVRYPLFLKEIAEEKNVDAAEVNQRCWFKESGQWHKNDDQTHLASGKLVLIFLSPFT